MVKGMEFGSIVYPFEKKDAIRVIVDNRTVEEYVAYINNNKIEQAEIILPSLKILEKCPNIKYLKIYPSYNATKEFDFSPLYNLPEVKMLNCWNCYGEHQQFCAEIDFSKLKGLEDLSFSFNKGTLNYEKIITLKSLSVGGFRGSNYDLTDLFSSKELDTLELRECKINSLKGIEQSDKMQCVYIYHNRSLKDISMLSKVKKTLKALHIEQCSKIEDFSVLEELDNLEMLWLWGNNKLDNLNFLKNLKKLKTFVFDVNILDGDLTPCLDIGCVHCDKNRKHYNLKDNELPKGEFVYGNEDIEIWRRVR